MTEVPLACSPDQLCDNFTDNGTETDLTDSFNLNIDLDYHVDEHDISQLPSSSVYYTENQIADKIVNNIHNAFSMLHFNVRSISKNVDALSLFLEKCKFQCPVIGLTETWLTHTSPLYKLPDFDFITNNRNNKRGGGVALYISQNYQYKCILDLNIMSNSLESLFVEITVPNDKNIVIGVLYKPPHSSSIDFLNTMQDILLNPVLQRKKCFIMGDFNINFLHCDEDNLVHDFLDLMSSHSFLPFITKPTRHTNHSFTLIDNVFSNCMPPLETGIIISDISDHFPIYLESPNLLNSSASKPCMNMNKTNRLDIPLFKTKLVTTDWNSVLNEDEVNNSFNNCLILFNKHNNDSVTPDKCTHYKKVPRQPWLNKSLLKCIHNKNKLL